MSPLAHPSLNRLATIMALVVLAGTLAVALLALRQSWRDRLNLAQSRAMDDAALLAERLQARLDALDMTLVHAGNHDGRHHLEATGLEGGLALPASIAVLRPDGDIQMLPGAAGGSPTFDLAALRDLAGLDRAYELTASAKVGARPGGIALIRAFAAPGAAAGSPPLTLVGLLDAGAIRALLNDFRLAGYPESAILGSDAALLASNPAPRTHDASRWWRELPLLGSLAQSAFNRAEAAPVISRTAVAGFARMARFPLRTVVALDRQAAMASWREDATGLLLPYAATLLLAAGLASHAARARKRASDAERGREASERRFAALFQHAADPILHYELEGTYLDANPAALTRFGLDLDRIRRMPHGGIETEATHADFPERVRRLLQAGHARYEVDLVGGDGTPFPAEISAAIYERDGKPRGVSVVRDMSQRKRLEAELREALARMDLIIRCAGLGTWDWNVATGEVRFNDIWARMLGFEPGEVAPEFSAWEFLLHPGDKERVIAELSSYLNAGNALHESIGDEARTWRIEHRLRTRAGDWAWVLGIGRVVERAADGKPLRAAGINLDINDRKRAEALREDMERVMRHDLRTPVAGAVTTAQLLKEATNLTPEQRRILHHLEVAGWRALHLINVSLDLVHMERGTYEMAPQPCDLAEILALLVEELEPLRQAYEVGIDIGAVDGAHVPGDRFLLQAMLDNLLKNAIEASQPGQTVRVSLRREPFWMTIDIHNHAAVPASLRPRFFEKYATAGKAGGTGLGTYSARLMARAHGGDITLASSEDAGTTVSVRLPL